MSRLILVILLSLGMSFTAAGQLPRFHFIGTPNGALPSEWEFALKDMIICRSETAESRWDDRKYACYLYSVPTKTWTHIQDLGKVEEARLINDSLVLCTSYDRSDSTFCSLWDPRADSLVFSFRRSRRVSSEFYTVFTSANASGQPIFIDQGKEGAYRYIAHQEGLPPDTTLFTLSRRSPSWMQTRDDGFWITFYQDSIVLWTQDFRTFDSVFLPEAYLYSSSALDFTLDVDGTTLIELHSGKKNDLLCYVEPPNVLSTYRLPASSINSNSMWLPMSDGVIFQDNTGNYTDDGFYRMDTSGVQYLGRTEHRIWSRARCRNSDGSVTLITNSGFMLSNDTGRTWTSIDLPVSVSERSNSTFTPTILLADDGTLVWSGGRGRFSYFDRTANSFIPLPGTTVFGTGVGSGLKPYSWYRRGEQWFGLVTSTFVFSLERGLWMAAKSSAPSYTWDSPKAVSYKWLDTAIVKGTGDLVHTCWPPGGSVQRLDYSANDWSIYKYEQISDPIDLGGGKYCIATRPEWIELVDMTRPYHWTIIALSQQRYKLINTCQDSSSTLSYVFKDTLYSWIENSRCGFGLAHPVDVLFLSNYQFNEQSRRITAAVNYPVREARQLGHDSNIIGLIKKDRTSLTPDSVVIMPPDQSTQMVFPLEGIDEPYVYRLLYDKVNRVYYAQTARGIYCSDVATSVETSDGHQDYDGGQSYTGDVRTTWYTILGAEVAEPNLPGMYLKITVSASGTRNVEKVAISPR